MRGWRCLVLAAVVIVAGSGCADALDPTTSGIIDARVQDDADPTMPGGADLPGSAVAALSISVRRVDSGNWISLGPMQSGSVDLQGRAPFAWHGPQLAPAGLYDRLRVTIQGAEVVVGADPPATLSPAVPIVLELAIDTFALSQDETVFLVVALNAEQWDRSTALVPESSVIMAVTALVNGVTP